MSNILIDNKCFLTLDIETSTHTIEENGKIVPLCTWLSYGVVTKTYVNGNTIYRRFRTWEELKFLLDRWQWHKVDGSTGKYQYRRLCFVHNLSYEFEFLIRNVAKPKFGKLIANGTHHVVASELDGYNIEFRCTLQLSNMRLSKLGEILNCPKGEDNYETLYPNEYIEDCHWEYCERDNEIVVKYVQSLIDEYGKLDNLPYTKTGRVRKYYKEQYQLYNKGAEWAKLPEDKTYIELMTKSYYGGITISNPKYTGYIIEDNIVSQDIASSYPYAMVSEVYPSIMEKRDDHNCQFWIANVTFTNIKSKFDWCWFPASRAIVEDEIIFNGKIVSASSMTITITNVDYETIKMCYNFDDVTFNITYGTDESSALPECYLNTVEHYSRAKVEAKDAFNNNPSNDNRVQYSNTKSDFNSIYGMTVQALYSDDFEIDEDYNWIAVIREMGHKGQRKDMQRNFLFGVYITAYARRNLVMGIIYNCPDTFIYADTDSIKYIYNGKPFVDPMKKDGNLHYINQLKDNKYIQKLGGFDNETEDGFITRFKTYGAKKYCYVKNGKTNIVVAGLPKNFEQYTCNGDGTIANVKKNAFTIDEFTLGTVFPHCKLAHKFIFQGKTTDDDGNCVEDERIIQFMEDHNINDNGGVALYSVGYQLGINKNDSDYIYYKYGRMVS